MTDASMDDAYDELDRLMGAYFHQDWTMENSSADEVVRLYISETGEALQQRLSRQIHNLLAQGLAEPEMQALLFDQFGCAYHYLNHWATSRAWLAHILELLPEQEHGLR